MPVGIMANYKHCPLKKRPVFIAAEEVPEIESDELEVITNSANTVEQYEPENLCTKPEDLSVKRTRLSSEELSAKLENPNINSVPVEDDEVPQDYCIKYEYKRPRISPERSISPRHEELYMSSQQHSPAEYKPEYTTKYQAPQEVPQRNTETWPYVQAENDWNANHYYDPNHLEKSHQITPTPHERSVSPPLGYHAFMPPQSTTHDYRRGKSDYYVNNNHRYLPYNNVAHLRHANQSQLSPTYSYASYGSVESTRESMSPSSISSNHGDTMYPVSVLSERTSTSEDNVMPSHHRQSQHQQQQSRIVDAAPRFKCENCAKCYSTSVGLSKHQQFHCPAAEGHIKKVFSCKSCDKVYTSLGALKMHIRTHTLPCKCPICGKAFSRPWLLQGHIRTHTGEKPFKCDYCDRAFADRSNLRAHLQTHADIKKYQCNVCMKSFSRMSLLSKHSSSCNSQMPGV